MFKKNFYLVFCTCLVFNLAVISIVFADTQGFAWKRVSNGISDSDLRIVEVNPGNPEIVFVSSRKVIYKTTDGGKNWDEVLSFRGTENIIFSIAADPSQIDSVYAGTKKGLYKSSDKGESWSRISQSIRTSESYVLCVAVHPSNPSIIFIGTGRGIYHSENGGKDWERARNVPNTIVYDIIIDRFNPDTIYASTSEGLYKSSNNSSNWERLSISYSTNYEKDAEDKDEEDSFDYDEEDYDDIESDIRAGSISIDPARSIIAYIGTRGGLYISSDSGSSWKAVTSTGLITDDIHHIIISNSEAGNMYAATSKGVFRYTSTSRSWEALYQGLTSSNINDVTIAPSLDNSTPSLWAATKKGVFKTEVFTRRLNAKIEGMEAEDILQMFAHEPTIEEIRESAIEYASVHPDKIEKWKKAAANKAWLPSLSFAYQKKEDWQSSSYKYNYSGERVYTDDDITDGQDKVWSVSLSWNLSNIIWNTSQTSIEIRSNAMVKLRDDILNEVTRLYFERRRLQIEMVTASPQDVLEKLERDLRLEELTANIDALTGSYLSKRLMQGSGIGVQKKS